MIKNILKYSSLVLATTLSCSFTSLASIGSWKYENNNWKYYNSSNVANKSWLNLGTDWYYFDENSNMKTSWLNVNGTWYFLNISSGANLGKMLKSWQWIDGYCYYFDTNSGRMYANEKTPDGYFVNTNGRWTNEAGIEIYNPNIGITTKKVPTLGTSKTNALTTKATRGGGGGGGRSGGGRIFSPPISNESNNITNIDKEKNIIDNKQADTTTIPSTKTKEDSVKKDSSEEKPNTEKNKKIDDDKNIKVEEKSENKTTDVNKDVPTSNKDTGEEKPINKEDNKKDISHTEKQEKDNSKPQEQANSENKSSIGENPPTIEDNKNPSIKEQPTIDDKNTTDGKNNTNDNMVDNKDNKTDTEISKPVDEAKKEENKSKIKEELESKDNSNVSSYIDENGEEKTIIWVKGITPPKMGENGDFKKDITVAANQKYEYWASPFLANNAWYDTNKAKIGGNTTRDRNLCFAATATNMLQWWLEQNKDNIKQYIEKHGDVEKKVGKKTYKLSEFIEKLPTDQENSLIFDYYKDMFGYNEKGFYADLLLDLFFNGYTPKENGGTNYGRDDFKADSRGAFFYDIFGGNLLSERTYGGSYEDLSSRLKDFIGENKIVALSHTLLGSYNHVITIWGAEYDTKGKLTAIYVTDSDDQNDDDIAMKRYLARNVNGIAKVGTNISDKNSGSAVGNLYTLSLNEESFENYIAK